MEFKSAPDSAVREVFTTFLAVGDVFSVVVVVVSVLGDDRDDSPEDNASISGDDLDVLTK